MRGAMAEATFLGIEIGGTKLQIVQGDSAGAITKRWRATVDRERGTKAAFTLVISLAPDPPRTGP